MRLLVVEDDIEMADAVARGLRRAMWAVDVAYDGSLGLDMALVNDYDVVVLDRDLPGLHGDEICKSLVAEGSRCRVLMLTAAADNADMIGGLGIGADDYLVKPFDFAVLLARIGALLRRAQPAHPPTLRSGNLILDTAARQARLAGEPLNLTPKEFAVLELLLAADGRAVSSEELLERAWDTEADAFSTAVKITISRLRTKLGDGAAIHTVARAGYRMDS